jgi:hypothetical protein
MENGKCGTFAKYGEGEHQKGLTKREYFAGLAMQALITNGQVRQVEVVICAVDFADDLLKELEKDGRI